MNDRVRFLTEEWLKGFFAEGRGLMRGAGKRLLTRGVTTVEGEFDRRGARSWCGPTMRGV